MGNPIGFFKSSISQSTFIGPSLRRIQIKDCVAVDVDFREANLSEADLPGTDLSNSLFGKTNLSTRQCQSRGTRPCWKSQGCGADSTVVSIPADSPGNRLAGLLERL